LNKTSAGVVVNKRVRNRVIPKKMNIRIEHLRTSKCREVFKARVTVIIFYMKSFSGIPYMGWHLQFDPN
jgi:hypothetical protein